MTGSALTSLTAALRAPMRAVIEVAVPTRTDPATVYAYLRDFSHAAEWDSGTESCVRISGDGAVGSVYRNVSRFGGLRVELLYTVERDDEPVFVIEGRNATTTGRDTITVRSGEAGGSVVDYHADFRLETPWPLRPVVRLLLHRLGRQTAARLGHVLDALPQR